MPQVQATVETSEGGRVEMVGHVPDNKPYLRIEDNHGKYVGSVVGVPALRRLRDAITDAIENPDAV